MVGTQRAYANAGKVLNTTELLEAILDELPIGDLLFSQRVSRTIKDTIGHSISLQHALFSAADPPITEAVQIRPRHLIKSPLFDGTYEDGPPKYNVLFVCCPDGHTDS